MLSVAKNETAWGVASVGSAAGLMQGGLVRPLAMTSPARFPLFPDVPTFTEAGLKEMELSIYYLVHAPASLPIPILRTLNQATASSLTLPATRQRFLAARMQAWEGANTPESTRAIVEAELGRKLVSERTGIKISG